MQQKCLNKWVGSETLWTRFYNFQLYTPTLSPQTPHVTILFMLLQNSFSNEVMFVYDRLILSNISASFNFSLSLSFNGVTVILTENIIVNNCM